ncbi:MAG: hypothetical protein FI735_04250 [SAR202 cluster bacterium]|nr:hypothetical protein [SAR202 cluster bacterium]|tara:strand:+ start:2059 stop:2916 length:858 start_codon:yes stop_codon:yes gene_type:complete
MLKHPKFLAIGHLSFDVNIVDGRSPSDRIPGGASAYAALVAKKHGISSGILTSVGDDYPVEEILSGIDVRGPMSEHTSSFANYYDGDNRNQVLIASGSKIFESEIPVGWTQPNILYVGPLLHEVPTDIVNWFEPELSCLVPSGWLRRWGADGVITHARSLVLSQSKKWDVIVVSEAEIANLSLEQLRLFSEIICITRGQLGARIWNGGDFIEIPAIKSAPVDLTGAGDVWASAFALAVSDGRSIEDAGVYASAASAIGIESIGLLGCPSPTEIENRLADIHLSGT